MNEEGVEPVATLTCPFCGREEAETMPEDACVAFWACPGCGAFLQHREGECCVFCSYGDVPCPPVQRGQASQGPGSGG